MFNNSDDQPPNNQYPNNNTNNTYNAYNATTNMRGGLRN